MELLTLAITSKKTSKENMHLEETKITGVLLLPIHTDVDKLFEHYPFIDNSKASLVKAVLLRASSRLWLICSVRELFRVDDRVAKFGLLYATV